MLERQIRYYLVSGQPGPVPEEACPLERATDIVCAHLK